MIADDTTPFYLISNNNNIILNSEIHEFKSNNPELSKYIDSYSIELRPIEISNFEAFCYWIIGQQISGKAAQAISNRFRSLIGNVQPNQVADISHQKLVSVGLSRSKAEYIQNLTNFFISTKMPNFTGMSNSDIIGFFSQVRGIGEWTVQMHLIFSFGRKNVLAAKDLVVRKGIKKLYGLVGIPTESKVYAICKNWGNLATLGSIISWAVMGE